MIRVLVSRLIEAERRLSLLGVDDLLPAVVRSVMRHSTNEGKGMRSKSKLRELAASAGLSMLEAHRALHQLIDRELVSLANDELLVPDREALLASLDAE
jgi:hypothetical protein